MDKLNYIIKMYDASTDNNQNNLPLLAFAYFYLHPEHSITYAEKINDIPGTLTVVDEYIKAKFGQSTTDIDNIVELTTILTGDVFETYKIDKPDATRYYIAVVMIKAELFNVDEYDEITDSYQKIEHGNLNDTYKTLCLYNSTTGFMAFQGDVGSFSEADVNSFELFDIKRIL